MSRKLYLNLGAGTDIRTSIEDEEVQWINLDIRALPGLDKVQNACNLSFATKDTVDFIVAQHLLEYIPRKKMVDALTEWKRVLKPKATLEIRVTAIEELTKALYLNTTSKEMGIPHEMVIALLYGKQETPHDVRFNGFTQEYLEGILAGIDFTVINSIKEDYDIIITAQKK